MSETITPQKAELLSQLIKEMDELTISGKLTEDKKKLYEQLVLNFTNPNHEWGHNNLRDLVVLFHESGKTPEQIYNILYTMGIDKNTAYYGVLEYTPKKNIVKMNLKESLNIKDRLHSLIDAVKMYNTSDTLNFNAKTIEGICESYINLDYSTLSAYEQSGHIKRLITELNQYNFMDAVAVCIKALEDALIENAIGLELDAMHSRLANSNQKAMYNPVINRIEELRALTESEIRAKAKGELLQYTSIVPELKLIIEKIDLVNGNTTEQPKTVFEQFNFRGRIKSLTESVKKYEAANSDFTVASILTICEKHLNSLYGNNPNSSETQIAQKFVHELSSFMWIEPVAECVKSIIAFVNENYMSFEVSEVLRRLENAKGNAFYTPAIDKLNGIKNLTESEIRENVKYQLDSLTWIPEIKRLVETVNSLNGNLSTNTYAVVDKVYSPVTEMNGQTIFYLSGNVYGIKENQVTLIDPNTLTAAYLTLIAVEETFKFGANDMTCYKGGHTIRLALNEEGKADFYFNGYKIETIKESNDIRNFLLSNGSFKLNEMDYLNLVVAAYENINEFTELDFVQSISSRVHEGVKVNIIRIAENVYINRINPSMRVNEFKKAENANQAIELVKEYVNYDPSASLIDLLEGEAKNAAMLESKKNDIYTKINFLKEQRGRLAETGIVNESIKQADELLISEIEKWQKELNSLLK